MNIIHEPDADARAIQRHPEAAAVVEIVSFGFGHGPAPAAHTVVDVRHHFRDPHAIPALRHRTADHPAVMQAVMETAGVPELVRTIADLVYAFHHAPQPGPITIAIGCVGGRHRSAAIAIATTDVLTAEGFHVVLTHRDIDKDVITRPTTESTPGTKAR